MSGIVGQIGARSGILDSGGIPSAGTVTQSGTTQLDYEEGTWTVTASHGSISSSSTGFYTKVGRLVSCNIYVLMTSTTNSGSDQYTVNLPFVAANNAGASNMTASGAVSYYYNLDSSKTSMGIVTSHNNATAALTYAVSNLNNDFAYTNNLKADFQFLASITYETS